MDKVTEVLNLLLKKKLISNVQIEDIQSTASREGKTVDEVILEKKIVNEEVYIQNKAEIYGFPYASIIDLTLDPKIIQIIPAQVAENYRIICFDKKDNQIMVGLLDPNDFKAIEAVDFLAKRKGLVVKYHLISSRGFEVALQKYSSLTQEVATAVENREKAKEEEAKEEKEEEGEMKEVTKSAPVAKIVSVIIRHAVEGGASDIHIEPLANDTRVRYRIDGVLHTSLVLPKNVHASVVARIKVLANLKIDETRTPQDGRIRIAMDKRNVDFRVSILPLVGTEKVVMRILEAEKKPPSLDALGFQGPSYEIMKEAMSKTEGMLLVTGPTGSGKSTTLFSVLHQINKEGVNISTLEDPVEYRVEGVNQSQVKPEIGYTFAAGLRSFLRQDPDIIMVGEVRDSETAELSIHAALTGHFVLSTLHTINAAGSIPRMVDMKIEPFLLGTTLKVVVAQRLARKVCKNCRTETDLPNKMMEQIKSEIEKIPEGYIEGIIKGFDKNKLKYFKGKGCTRCSNSGFSGRVALVEVMQINEKMQVMITEGKKYFSTKEIQDTQQFITFAQDGIIKVLQGTTTMQEVLRVAQD